MAGADYGVFANGRWTLSKNLQEMMDWLEFKLQALKLEELQATMEKLKVQKRGKLQRPKEKPRPKNREDEWYKSSSHSRISRASRLDATPSCL